MMLGADPKGLADEDEAETTDDACPAEGGEKEPPMQKWRIWWFVRTYLQSLGQACSLCARGLLGQACARNASDRGSRCPRTAPNAFTRNPLL